MKSNEILLSQRTYQLTILMLEMHRLLHLTILEKNNDHKNRQFWNKATPAFENILQHLSISTIFSILLRCTCSAIWNFSDGVQGIENVTPCNDLDILFCKCLKNWFHSWWPFTKLLITLMNMCCLTLKTATK